MGAFEPGRLVRRMHHGMIPSRCRTVTPHL
jgi:hypothetical protein